MVPSKNDYQENNKIKKPLEVQTVRNLVGIALWKMKFLKIRVKNYSSETERLIYQEFTIHNLHKDYNHLEEFLNK